MKILIADDDPLSLLYLQDTLEEWGYEVLTASDGDSAKEILLRADAPMMAILDWMMPGMDGTDICRQIRETVRDRYIYLIMLTARAETEFLVQAMNAGADDFISKPFMLEELQVRLRAGRRICELEQELRIRAQRDALTGLYNRGAIIEILQKEIARRDRSGQPVSIIFADLDHFKRVNDRYGHPAGDDVLREAARRVASVLRPYDALARYGGEELLIVLPECDAGDALAVARRVREAVAAGPVITNAGPVPVSLSIGVATSVHASAVPLNVLIKRADDALYRAKENGRNRVEVAG